MSVVTLDETITFALSVKDRHASAAWYSDMLGFTLKMHIDEAGWSELETMTKGVTIGLGEQAEPAPGNAVPVFGVADITVARTALEQAGVRFDGPTDTMEGMVSLATFYDPDGNALMMAQDLSGG
ncbi:Glyoxalase family protein [Sulfitobacter noctilucicola]|uniref:Putative enzyme related to lactoylglutathione lyase n=1 Tax=Sulfitobacter noctilucicola TaxID=1342301 RepID=A0A7W6Q4W9_9RHOB|nr:VOC family protein [Sulfitobacter noctilucicola]KIN62326.1 Glyoxalase family protein [Sulfitobacter noctilucicola]MBB4173140.1 putative enzyme related to lactoylglutathione lyase [Sulfitobacter noctilucicola]